MAATSTLKKGPGGRPKKAEAERRSVQRKTRYTIAEDIHVKQQAAAAGMTDAAYVRHRALGLPVVVRQAKTDARLIHELNAIGVNLNQIARNMNAGRAGVRAVDFDDLQGQLRDVLNRALDAFND